MSSTSRKATPADAVAELEAAVEHGAAVEPVVDASICAPETEPAVADQVAAELQQARLALLKAFNAAVSPSNGGLDIVLGRQVAEVYHFLFGETR